MSISSVSSLSSMLTAAYLNQLSSENSVCLCEKCSETGKTSQSNTSFSEVLQSQRARQLNQENYNRLKEAAGGNVPTTKTYTERQGNTKQNTLLQYQRLLRNLTMLNSYGMNIYSGYGLGSLNNYII